MYSAESLVVHNDDVVILSFIRIRYHGRDGGEWPIEVA